MVLLQTQTDVLILNLIAILSFQDEKLKKLVELHGSEDWKLIASLLTVSNTSVGSHMHAHRQTEHGCGKVMSKQRVFCFIPFLCDRIVCFKIGSTGLFAYHLP